jgi:hypothetical protein
VGGGVALAVSSLVFPLDPQLHVGRAAQSIFGQLGRVLEQVAAALEAGDRERAESALAAARNLDGPVRELEDALETARETARSSPLRRPVRAEIDRYARGARHVDYAVRNTRVLARHALRFLRSGRRAPDGLSGSIRELGLAVWALAEELDDPGRPTRLRLHVSRATTGAMETHSSATSDLSLAEIVVQVRSTGIDLLRASEAATSQAGADGDLPTEELLLRLPDPRGVAGEAA